MSLASWKKEFYPVEADTFEDKPITVGSVFEATQHAIKKWQGLSPSNLKRHGLITEEDESGYGFLVIEKDRKGRYNFNANPGVMRVTGDECALCQLFDNRCKGCPITGSQGVPCVRSTDPRNEESPFGSWRKHTDPKPMQKVLAMTLKFVLATDRKINATGAPK